MRHTKKMLKHVAFIIGFFCLVKCTSLLKMSFVAGSYTMFFGGTNIITPLAGLFGGILGSTGLLCLRSLVRFFLYGGLPFKSLAYFVPGYCASLYWAWPTMFVRLLLPLLCFVLFIAHPVGFWATPYALYWLIPIVLYFVPKKNIFLDALCSTFIAHAVGSVIWLYSVPMSIAQWYSLIPVVAIERFTFALGMVVVYNVIRSVSKKLMLLDRNVKPDKSVVSHF